MPTDLPPCAQCGHATPHPAELRCLADTGGAACPCPVYVPPTPVVVSTPTLERARAERDTAMERVEDATDIIWLDAAERAVAGFARSWPAGGFTTDDVWDRLTDQGVPRPREPRAMGPVIRRALTAGTIVPAGYTQSRRRHAAPIRTYTGAQG